MAMDKTRFMEILGEGGGEVPDEEFAGAVRRQLESAKRHHYSDISGNGTLWSLCGVYHGVGFSRALVRLLPGALVEVVVETGQRVKPEHEKELRKLFRAYNSRFRIRGLAVEGGCTAFRTEPFDPLNGRFDADKAVGMVLSALHAFAGVSMALDAGVPAWKLLDYKGQRGGFSSDDDDDDDDDGGTSLEEGREAPSFSELIRMLHSDEEPARLEPTIIKLGEQVIGEEETESVAH